MKTANKMNYLVGKQKISPKKNKMLMGVTFTKKASIRTLNISNNKDLHHARQYRGLTHSIEQLHHSNSVQNVEIDRKSLEKLQKDDEMFGRSYAKIQRMKGAFLNPNIDAELNDILLLIKTEKLKIRERMRCLQRDNTYFRKLCEGRIQKSQAAVNTQHFISDGIEAQMIDKSTQYSQQQLAALSKTSDYKMKKQKQAYSKLKVMLTEMNINPSQILPQQEEQQINQFQQQNKPFKTLSDAQIIKIQHFFIKKLALKMQK